MPYPQRIGYIGIGKQTAKGSGAPPTKFIKWDGSTKMTPDMGYTRYREGGDGYNPGIVLKENHKPDGNFSLLARPDITAFLLAMWGGQDTVTGTGAPYQHVIIPKADGTRPWVSIDRSLAGVILERTTDARIKAVILEGEPGKPVKDSVEYLGSDQAIQGSAATETYETAMPFIHFQGTYSKDGVESTAIAGWKITFTNNFDAEDFTNAITRRDIPLVSWDVEVEFTLKLESANATVYKDVYFGGGTTPGTSLDDGSFTVALTYGTGADLNSLTVEVPTIIYTEAPVELSTDDGTQAFAIKAVGKKGGSALTTITAKNATSAAYV